jgi:glycosyltransferase involved in cell wall biosynthesis
MSKTTLIISTRDRPAYLIKALRSALKQTHPFNNIIISDNSSSRALKNKNKSLLAPYLVDAESIVKLIPTPTDFKSDEHTKFIQKNYVSDDGFCILFHDDDELLPNYHEVAVDKIENSADVVAVGCNAVRLLGSREISGTSMRRRKGIKIIKNARELQKCYMEIRSVSPPPLCGYLFRAKALKSISFDSAIGGKYSDVVALSEAASLGKLLWIFEPLLKYRTHSEQDSQNVSTLGFRSLLNYMLKQGELACDSQEAVSYRYKHMRLKLKGLAKRQKLHSFKIVVFFLICFTLKNLIWRQQTYAYLWALLRKK